MTRKRAEQVINSDLSMGEREKKIKTEFLMKGYLFCFSTVKNIIWNNLSLYLAQIFPLLCVGEKEKVLSQSSALTIVLI